jgi:DNA-binding NtrC family response regulator
MRADVRVIGATDDTWLQWEPTSVGPAHPLPQGLSVQERTLIEQALAAKKGKRSDRSGAAARVKMPESTLEARIRALGIDKNRFRTPY